jgi:hypothetical protein
MANENETTGSKKDRALPTGFTLVVMPTEAGPVKYDVEVPQGESLSAWLDALRALNPEENAEEIVVRILNAQNAQGARQGPKKAVRDAATEHGVDSPEVTAAVEAAQANSRGYITGAPRAGGGGGKRHESGLTEKQRTALGTAIGLELAKTGKMPTQSRLAEIAKELGIAPEKAVL